MAQVVGSMEIEVLPEDSASTSTGNGSSPKITRKRKRRPEKWKRNVLKAKRVKGEQYETSSGKTIPPRQTGPPCSCMRQCMTKFTDDQKSRIITSFNQLEGKNAQDAHLHGLIRAKKVQRCRGHPASSRTASYVYEVSLDVCYMLHTCPLTPPP